MKADWNDARCSHTLRFLKKAVKKFEEAEGITECDVWMSSCRKGKISFHYVNKNFVLDRNYLSMRVAAWLLSRILRDIITWYLTEIIKAMVCPTKELYLYVYRTILPLLILEHQQDKKGWLMSNDTVVDESFYNRNQLFRLIGNHKLGKACFITTELSRCVTNANCSSKDIHSISKQYLKYIGYDMFESCLVSQITNVKGRTYVIPDSFPFGVKVQKAYLEEFRNEDSRGSVKTFDSKNDFCKKRAGKYVRFPEKIRKRKVAEYNYATTPLPPDFHTTLCIDEDELVIRADHVEVKIIQCAFGENIFHECEKKARKNNRCVA